MAVEGRRGCGYRKAGGLYLIGEGLSRPCAKLPALCEMCPVCGEGVKFSRSWRWIDPYGLFGGNCGIVPRPACTVCPFELRQAGLLWVGEKFYSPESFVEEAVNMGVCKRIPAVPRGFKLGETWVLLAHKKAGRKKAWVKVKKGEILPLDAVIKVDEPTQITFDDREGTKKALDAGKLWVMREVKCPAVFYAFRPTKLDLVVTEKMLADMPEEERKRKERQGISFFVVPDADPDHQGTVYDKEADA